MLACPDRTTAFRSAEAAWFWTAACLRAREQARPAPPGPCRIEDVVKCLDVLYRRRRIELLHVRILRHWGLRGVAPNPARPRERCDARLWREAIDRLDWPLRQQGIVAGPDCRLAEPQPAA
jgi:hypothetical protein